MHISPSIRSLLFAIAFVVFSAASFAQIGIAITIGPPALPVYEQPLCPGEGYIWTPGYWAYDYNGGGYYWVPGTWVEPPMVGVLWTPGYWGWGGDRFIFHEGYWGPHVGFYGGVAYGYGYFGEGYQGGRWDNGHFFYNRSVNNINVTNIHNVYNTTVINNVTVNRVSYNGGNGGINARPRSEDEIAERERHVPPVAAQTEHMQAARNNPELRASMNHGKPPIAATPRPGSFEGHGVVPAREAGAPYNSAASHENNVPRPPNAVHPADLPPHQRPEPPNTGNAQQDHKYQQQQEKLYAKQEQDHQKLEQKQQKEHQQVTQHNADEAKQQQMEQKHQQQTHQMEEKHQQQSQNMQHKQQSQSHNQQPGNEKH